MKLISVSTLQIVDIDPAAVKGVGYAHQPGGLIVARVMFHNGSEMRVMESPDSIVTILNNYHKGK